MATVNQILNKARSYLGVTQGSATHKAIIDRYNSVKPLPVGYTVKYTDDWCDAFITALAIEVGAVDIIGRECGVQRHIDIFKAKGIWIEDGTITPKAGDIITFNWDDWSSNNNGFADHIGIVESVSNGQITTIEGNTSRAVLRRTYQVGNGWIRGFARPNYSGTSITVVPEKKSNDTIANEVIAGVWGSGDARKTALTNAGYNAQVIQDLVNAKLKGTASKKTNQQIAEEIYRGLGSWGNGETRKSNLIKAGYDPNAIQTLVNALVGNLGTNNSQDGWVAQKGSFELNTAINLRSQASQTSQSILLVQAGQVINYDAFKHVGGYVWIRQPRADGSYGYLATGESVNGVRQNYWGTFF